MWHDFLCQSKTKYVQLDLIYRQNNADTDLSYDNTLKVDIINNKYRLKQDD